MTAPRLLPILPLFILACSSAPRTIEASAPVGSVELLGESEAIVRLLPGVSARTLLGTGVFADFTPDLDSSAAVRQFGEPKETVKGEGETLFIYSREGKRVAIVEQVVRPSDGGPSTQSYTLRSWPGPTYAETLPSTLRQLISRREGKHSIIIVSTERSDWNIEIHVENRLVSYLVARQRPDRTS